jgi:hypothetical protein
MKKYKGLNIPTQTGSTVEDSSEVEKDDISTMQANYCFDVLHDACNETTHCNCLFYRGNLEQFTEWYKEQKKEKT